MTTRQIDKKVTKQIRIDAGLHKLLKIQAAEVGKTIRELVESCLIEYLPLSKGG